VSPGPISAIKNSPEAPPAGCRGYASRHRTDGAGRFDGKSIYSAAIRQALSFQNAVFVKAVGFLRSSRMIEIRFARSKLGDNQYQSKIILLLQVSQSIVLLVENDPIID